MNKLRSYPSSLIEIENGIIVTRGVVKFKIAGCDAYRTVQKIIRLTRKSIDESHLLSQFDPIPISAIKNLIKMLVDRNILYYSSADESLAIENEEDIFYWQFNTSPETRNDLKNRKILIVGRNAISTYLINALNLSGFYKITLLNDPILRNSNFEFKNKKINNLDLDDFLNNNNSNYDCVIATTDFNTKFQLQFWNKICLDNNWPYFPLSLNNIHGVLGPYVIPGETACYECFISRESSNLSFHEFTHKNNHGGVTENIANGFHPMMPSILAGLAGIELAKIFSCLPNIGAGNFIDINFITQEMNSRKILRIPFCKACS